MAPSKRNASRATTTGTSKTLSTAAGGAGPSSRHHANPDIHNEDIGEGLSSLPIAPGHGAMFQELTRSDAF